MAYPKVTFNSGFITEVNVSNLSRSSLPSHGTVIQTDIPIHVLEGTYDERDQRGKSVQKSSLFYLPASSDGKPVGTQAIMPSKFLDPITTQPYCVGLSGINSLDDPNNEAFKLLCNAFKAKCLSVPVDDENYLLAQQILVKMANDAEAKAKRLLEEKYARDIKALEKQARSLEISRLKKIEAETRRANAKLEAKAEVETAANPMEE
jgi:hypothetical protein